MAEVEDESTAPRTLEYSSIKELADRAEPLKIDSGIEIVKYYRSARPLLQQAKIYQQEEDLENAYIHLLKFASFIVVLRTHKQYPTFAGPEKEFATKQLKSVIEDLEKLKQTLNALYEKKKQEEEKRKDLQRQLELQKQEEIRRQNEEKKRQQVIQEEKEQEKLLQNLQKQQLAFTAEQMQQYERFGKKEDTKSMSMYMSEEEQAKIHSQLENMKIQKESYVKPTPSPISTASSASTSPSPSLPSSEISLPSVSTSADPAPMTPSAFAGMAENVTPTPPPDPAPSYLSNSSTHSSIIQPGYAGGTSQSMHVPIAATHPGMIPMSVPIPMMVPNQLIWSAGPSAMPMSYAVSPTAPPTPSVVSKTENKPPVTNAGSQSKSTSSSSTDRKTVNGLRKIHLDGDMFTQFMDMAQRNTNRDIETCGILAGTMRQNQLYVTHLLIPKQEGSSDTCQMTNEDEVFLYCDENNLMTFGWIHTHPSHECFLSSVDMHTHFSYQFLLKEAVAVVMAPRMVPNFGIFSLTDPFGLHSIQTCDQRGFHPHDRGLYRNSEHVVLSWGKEVFKVIDLRRK